MKTEIYKYMRAASTEEYVPPSNAIDGEENQDADMPERRDEDEDEDDDDDNGDTEEDEDNAEVEENDSEEDTEVEEEDLDIVIPDSVDDISDHNGTYK
jgi:hypothetical protein